MAGFLVFALLQLADVYTTIRVLREGGEERNRLVRYLMDRLDWGWILVKLAIAAGAAWLIYESGSVWPIWALNALYAYVVAHNYREMRR